MAWLNLPDGNQIESVLVRSVMLYVGKGVALRDAQQRLIAFVKIEDADKGVLAREALLQRVKNQRSTEIDWRFLKTDSASDNAASSENVTQ